jgi:peptide/nickel transport system substrate-binding protein
MVVQSWRPGQALVLGRNPSWSGRPARLDRIVLQVIPDPAAQLRALLAGQVQVIAPYAQAGLADQLAGSTGVEYFAGAGLAWDRVDLNLRTPALRERALRQALFTAIDLGRVRSIGAEVFGGAEPMGSHIFVPGQRGYRDQLTGTGQGTGDLAAARRILTAAGYTGVDSALVGPDGTAVPALRAAYVDVNPARRRIADYLAEVARELGLTVSTTSIPPGGYGDALTDGQFDLIVYGWAIPPAPVTDAQQSWTSKGVGNYSGYADPQVDRLIEDAASTADPAAPDELLNQVDRLLTRDAVVLPLFRRPTLLAARQEVANVRDNATVGPLYNVAEWGLRD